MLILLAKGGVGTKPPGCLQKHNLHKTTLTESTVAAPKKTIFASKSNIYVFI